MKYALMILLAMPGVASAQSDSCGPDLVSSQNSQFQQVGLIFGRRGSQNCGPGGCQQSSTDVRFSQSTAGSAPVTPRNSMRTEFRSTFERSSGQQQEAPCDDCADRSMQRESAATIDRLERRIAELEVTRERQETSSWAAPSYSARREFSFHSEGSGYATYAGSRAARRAMAAYGYPARQPATPVRDFIQAGRAGAAQARLERQMYNAAVGASLGLGY